MPLDGSPETVTPASLPAVAVPEPEPDVVQNANATAVTATTPAAPSAISTRFLVSFLPNIHCPPWSFEEPPTGLILISAASSWEPPTAPGMTPITYRATLLQPSSDQWGVPGENGNVQ